MNRLLHKLVIAGLTFAYLSAFAQAISDPELTRRPARVESEQRSQAETHHKIQQIESKLNKIEKDDRETSTGLFISGIFCTLWAQYTRLSSWLWFFFGLILAPLVLIVLVWKNANDLHDGKMRF